MFIKRSTLFTFTVLMFALLVACNSTPSSPPSATEEPEAPATAIPEETSEEATQEESTAEEEHTVHWSYEGEGAPEHWAELDAANALCASGTEQSPVDIPTDAPANAANLHFDYSPSKVNILNNGHTIQVKYDEGSTVEIDGEPYTLQQFHFHAASEHTIDGAHTPLEMHLVHANAAGGLAVVGVMLVEGAENPAFTSVLDNMPSTETEATTIPEAIVNALELLPAEQSYYRLNGSLTTPHCDEGVKWHVMEHPVELSAAQIAQFTAIFDNNYRPTQPMGEREFIVTAEASAEHAIHWAYEGEGGPENWAELDAAYEACGAGVEQSPINIAAEAPLNSGNLHFDYQETAVNIFNNGHTIQVNYDEGSSVAIDGETYQLIQLHFHGPSEHTLAGSSADMEMHLVHADADGNLAVVGAMMMTGAENPAYAAIFDNIPAEMGDPQTVDGVSINAADLLPADRSYYRYDGSLTTPPCSEGVKWHVLSQPVELSADQMAAFTAVVEPNNRPVQLLNERQFIVTEEATAEHPIHWAYEGEAGPEYWAELDAAYEACGAGLEQSPIDLTASTAADLVNILFDYAESNVNILNNGHTIQVNYDEGSSINVGEHVYNLRQFHFHSPSEHAVDGVLYPLEMHLVHADADGNLAVVGVLVSEGEENPAFTPVWADVPAEEIEAQATGMVVNAADFLPAEQVFYRYNGSLTTPPCSEGVLWSVMATPIEMSAEQIAAFTTIFEGNNRPLQPLNDRDLGLDETP